MTLYDLKFFHSQHKDLFPYFRYRICDRDIALGHFYQQIRTQLEQYLEQEKTPENIKQQISILWDTPLASADQSLMLDQLINSLVLTNMDVANLVRRLESTPATEAYVTPNLFQRTDLDPFVLHNVRLYYARWLAQSETHASHKSPS